MTEFDHRIAVVVGGDDLCQLSYGLQRARSEFGKLWALLSRPDRRSACRRPIGGKLEPAGEIAEGQLCGVGAVGHR
jgi:hypothetical protein